MAKGAPVATALNHGLIQTDPITGGLPSRELPRVLLELHACLKPRGVLFTSNPRGHNEEGWTGGRSGAYYDVDTWRGYVSTAGFVELNHYYRPAGLPREQ